MSTAAFPPRHILVVDDEPLVCDAVKMMLEFDGHTVDTCNSAQEALARLESGCYDVIFTDFKMPGMKGDELAATIKKRNPRQPVVMVTAYAEMLQAVGGSMKDVDCIVSKPFLLENLREAVIRVSAARPKPELERRIPTSGDDGRGD